MLRPILAILALTALGGIVLVRSNSHQGPPVAQETRKFDFKEPKVQKGDIAVIETSLGTIKFELLNDKAPKHCANFEKLTDAGFYDGTAFHRVVPNFMIQGGDPNTRGTDGSIYGQGDPGWKVDAEFNDVSFKKGIVGMARSQDPNSAGSQFFICVADATFLDKNYTVFGRVTEGQAVADKISLLPNKGSDAGNQIVDINAARVKSIKIVHPDPTK